MSQHAPMVCPRSPKPPIYVGKGYKAAFECPMCQRSTYQHLNFLAGRRVVCDGLKFVKMIRLLGEEN